MGAPAELRLLSPLTGAVVPLEDVPDPVFSARLMGDGVAIEPLGDTLVAPCDARIAHLHPAGHAISLSASASPAGVASARNPRGTAAAQGGRAAAAEAQILLHVGVETVGLGGRGFFPHVREGDQVYAGQRLLTFDADLIAREVPSLQTVVVLTNGDDFEVVRGPETMVEAGRTPLFVLRHRAPTAEALIAGLEAEAVCAGEVVVGHPGGIHARPAAIIRAAARRFAADVRLEHADRVASASSVAALLRLGAGERARVRIRARGRDAPAALGAIIAAIESPPASDGPGPAGGSVPLELTAPRPASPGASATGVLSGIAAGPGLAVGPGASAPGVLSGIAAAPGLAVGRVVRLDASPPEPPPHSGDLSAEYDRLGAALEQVRADLAALVIDAEARGGGAARDILAVHLALADDPEIIGAAERAVGQGESAGCAFQNAVRAECAALAALDRPLLAERAADLMELEGRVLAAMSVAGAGASASAPELFDASILVADDILVSDLTRLPRTRIAGICTARGGVTSHVSILARTLGVPALVGVGPPLLAVPHGAEVILDASGGTVELAPGPSRVDAARAAVAAGQRRAASSLDAARASATTRDGVTVHVVANVSSAEDAAEALRRGADGVGLLRTELLFVDRRDAPSEAEQAAIYQGVLDAVAGLPAIIRTLDAGGDKALAYLPLPAEDNPALGLRGVRVGLARPEILDAQLRAILRVRRLGLCRIMLPMITEVAELLAVRRRLDELARDLDLTERPELGVMVEVPAAALLAERLAAHADFFSIGTNDLTQYTMAMDRCHPGLSARLDPLHPAVLHLIQRTVAGAARHARPVGVCGTAASDLEAVPVLLGLGVGELSVSPAAIPEIKARVRGLDHGACRRAVPSLLDLDSAAAVRAEVRARWSWRGGEGDHR